MISLIRRLLRGVNIISFILVIFWGGYGIVYEILGPMKYEQFLVWLKIPWRLDNSLIIAYICLIIFWTSGFLLTKFFE